MIMRHQDGCQVPFQAQIRQQRKNFVAGSLVQITRRLIRQQQRRIPDERARNGHALLLAAGKFSRAMLRPVGQPDFIQPLARFGQRFRSILAPDQARQHHIFRTGEFRQQMVLLPDVTNLAIAEIGDLRVGERRHFAAPEPDGAARGLVESGDQIKQCALARAAFAHDGELFALRNREIQIPEDDYFAGARAVDAREIFKLDQRWCQPLVYSCVAYLRYPHSCMVNWLVIGIGDITRKRVIPAIQAQPRSVFHSVLTRTPGKAAIYPGVNAHSSIERALEDAAVDAVYVASPVALHAPYTIATLRAGKHVLCEKPTAMNYAEAESMVVAASECHRLLGVAFYRRLYPKLIRAKQLIDEGMIGLPVLAEANYHGWLESEERGWLRDPALAGGGPLYDTGSHRIDAFNFLFGKPVRATGLRSNAVHRLGVEDSATALIEYAGGVRGIVDVRWNSRIVRDQYRVIGTEGELNLDPLNGPGLRVATTSTTWEEQLPANANVHYPIIENFVNAVLDGSPLACPGSEAIQTDWVTAQVMQSVTMRN
jgi:predicted dehydrogenase